jgi:hypothetical protein
VITFRTDSFDNAISGPTIDAKFYTDIFKIRNHVELTNYANKTHDGHFELISEEQMASKNYAGIYARHLHLEPIRHACSGTNPPGSQLWLQEPTLVVTTTSRLGGFGRIHNDVYAEIDAVVAPGFASLGVKGNCYEQHAGVLQIPTLRLDKGAELLFSIGDNKSSYTVQHNACAPETRYTLGEEADALDVEHLTVFGTTPIDVVIRGDYLNLTPGESRCFPIIRYQSVDPGHLNNLQLKRAFLSPQTDSGKVDGIYFLTLDFDTLCNVVNLCIGAPRIPNHNRWMVIPDVEGVTTNPTAGPHFVGSGSHFTFTVKFDVEPPYVITTNRIVNGNPEVLHGVRLPNGEYEYTIAGVQSDIFLTIGPDRVVSTSSIDGTAVWSHDQTLHFRVNREDIASIYSITGQLVRRIELPEGETSVPMQRGVFIVTLKDGSVHRVIVQ